MINTKENDIIDLEEAIKAEEELANDAYICGFLCHANPNDEELDSYIDSARKHEQLAKWLKELRDLRINSKIINTQNKMTDAEIIHALEYCTDHEFLCNNKCPYHVSIYTLLQKSLDLISRKQKESNKYRNIAQAQKGEITRLHKKVEDLKAELVNNEIIRTKYDYYTSNIERLVELIYSICDDAVDYGLSCKGPCSEGKWPKDRVMTKIKKWLESKIDEK